MSSEPDAGSGDGLSVYLAHLEALGIPPEKTSIAVHRRLAAADRAQLHRLVDTPEHADVVLFTESHLVADWRLRVVQDHPLRTRFSDRSYCFNERSRPWLFMPGLYTSPPAGTMDRRFQVPWAYPGPGEVSRALAAASKGAGEPDLLFSFVGSPGPRCRQHIFAIRHPRAVIERVENFTFFDRSSVGWAQRREHYQEVTLRSKFVLSPRGLATSSIRLYETLAAGRVPVVFSDEWMPPAGPDWDSFSIRWPEEQAGEIGRHLEEREGDWPELATRARAAYETWFAEDIAFHRAIEALRPLVERGAARSFPRAGVRNRQFLAVGATSVVGIARQRAVQVRNRIRAKCAATA